MAEKFPDDAVFVAHHLSTILTDIADQLDSARDAGSFITALQSNGRAWLDLARLGPLVGCQVPAAMAAFVSAAAGRARTGVDDHEVEAMIAVNRRLAAQLAKVLGRPAVARQAPSLWSDWMGRQMGAITWRTRAVADARHHH